MKAKTLLNIKIFSSFLLLLNSRFQKFSKLLKFNNPNENIPLLGEARGGLILLLLFSTSFLSAQTLIPLTTDMVTNESGVGDATQIVDEQTEAGDPANNTEGEPFSTWYTGFNASTYPASAYIDLGEMYDLTDIYVYDMNNSGKLNIEFGSPGSWLPLTNINLNKYLKWRGKSVNAQTQYVRVTRETAGAIFAEVVLYGEVAGAPTPTAQKLAIEPSMMTNEMSLGDPGMLVDEQTEAGDPANNAGGSPTSVWFTNWSPSNHPANSYIDLGELHQISQVYLRDYSNKGDFEVSYGSPGNWTLLLTDDLKKFGKWKEHNVDVQTQYLRFTRTTTGANCSEVVLYGYPVDNDLDAIPPAGVSDLMASATTESSITFEWTAPGDDANTGTAASYDLRYSPNPIDNENFSSAIPIDNMPTPSIAGTTETATLDNLPPNSTYYVALKSTDEAGNTSPLSNILTATTDENTATTPDSFKIPINPSMIVNESGLGDATDLVDEQTTAGDPINDPSGKPTSVWFTGWNPANYPASTYLDFGKEYTLTSIFLFDTYNSGNVTISYGSPGNWIPLLTNSMPFYQKWHQHDTQITTQYLRVTRSSGGANVAEIVLYGYEDSPTANPPNPITDLSTSLPTPYSVQLSWTVPSENIGADAPVSYDLRYSTAPIDDTNFDTAIEASGLPTPANGGETEAFTLENLQSNTLYYFAIKSTSADDLVSEISNIASETTLDVLPNNQFIIPVDLNEVVNESGFGNPTLLFDEAELAGDPANNNSGGANTLWLPDFENHPASAYVDLKQTFLIDAVYLFDIIGTDEFIIEYGEPGAWQNLATVILDNLFTWTNVQTHVETRYLRFTRVTFDSNTREIVLYGSAAGLDPGPPADIADLSVTPSSTFATLEWTAPGDDENTGIATEYDIRYSTTPITSENFEDATQTEAPTPSIAGSSESVIVYNLAQSTTYYFAMKTTDEMGYTSGISNVVSTLTTTDTDTTPPAAITDLIETTVTATSVTLQWTSVGDDANIGTADVYDIRMSLQNITPATFFRAIPIEGEPLPVENGQLQSMTINQLPSNTEICFAMKTWDEVPNISDMSNVICVTTEELEEESKIPLSPSMVTNETEHGDASNLVDEQETAGEPATSSGGSPATTWTTPFNNDVPYPIHAYIDLGEPYIVTKLFLRDVGGQAPMTVSYGYPGHWTELFTDNLSGFFSWNQHNVFVNTRYIRISKSDPSANVNELVAYGYKVDGDNVDTTPPTAITDLTATPDGSSAMDVSWTSTGDDGNTGTATVYNLRYSTKPITAENFYEAKEFEAMPAPAIAGTAQSVHIEGLWAAATYYFAIQSLDENHNISDLSNIATAKTEEVIGGDARRISLSPDMILNESALGDATLLVDEQIEAGEPVEGDESSPQLFWTAGVNPWYYPVYAYIDLGAEYDLSNIFLYDDFEESTTGPISIEVGSPFDWTPLLTDDLEGVNTWNEHDLTEEETTVTTRYVRVKLHNPQTRMSEIVLYGTATEALEEDNTEETPHAFATMDNLIGLNAFIDDPLGRMQATGAVREYHQWRWDEGNVDANSTYPGYPNNENAFNPSYVTSNWNFDRFYENIQNMGLLNTPSMTGSAHWLNPPFNEVLSRPHHVGDDSEDPFSYIEHADHLYQWVARYGNNAVGSASLKLRADQPVLSGLGTIQYFENWNEPDAFWKDENVYFTPYDYAAMSSADYDGHQGAMGTTVGVKNADPTAKMAMAGITNLNLEYIRAIKLWADEYRGGSVPFDVINLHHYSNDAGLQHAGANNGISPEEDRLKEKLEEFVTYRNKYMPGKEIWLSEFGYDTNPTSAQRALQIGSYDNEEVQGQWLVRSYLAIAAAGIDKAQMFMLRDVNASDNTIFQSSGLTESPSNDWAAKPSWYYVYTMKNRLTGMTFDSEVASGNENVRIYKFTHPDGDAAYAVWSPTSGGTTVSGYDLSLAGGENQAVLVEMLEGDRDGAETALTINSGSVSVDVSERPVFVLVNDGVGAIPKRYTLEQQLALTTDMVTIESGVGQAERLVDEQALIGNPDLGSTTAPETIWISNGSVSSAYIDLGAEYDLTKIYLFDAVNSGDCTISIGEPGDWTPLFVDDLRYPGVWNAHVVNVNSRYVRVTMETATSFVGEVAIYAEEE